LNFWIAVPRHLLLLCNRPADGANAATISEHLDAIAALPGWQVWELSMLGDIPGRVRLDHFDAIGIHYTLHLSDPANHFLSTASISRLSGYEGLKCIWLHDEYRRVDAVGHILQKIGMDVIFSLAEGRTLLSIYPKKTLPQARLETVLAGYVAPHWLTRCPIMLNQRPIDVGYRARRPPYWLGALGQEKIIIGEGFARHPAAAHLSMDISVEEHDRLYGDAWISFLGRCKAVLLVESGASVIDFSGETEIAVEKACADGKFHSFDDVSRRLFADIDGKYVINPVSPRVFEAAAARTVMIAFEGKYSGIMLAWKHYIPLKKDFSNMADVVAALQDHLLLEKISENAYRDLAAAPQYSYEEFAKLCASVLSEEVVKRKHMQPACRHYTKQEFGSVLLRSPSFQFRKHIALKLQRWILSSSTKRVLLFRIWYSLPPFVRKAIKPALRLIGR
jgi:hypothetical protein